MKMKIKTSSLSPARISNAVPHQVVAERAYSIWLAHGRPEGRDYDHWVQAERQLLVTDPGQQEESLTSRLTSSGDLFGTDIERALDSIAPTGGQRSATSL
jgi:hypothetical protein